MVGQSWHRWLPGSIVWIMMVLLCRWAFHQSSSTTMDKILQNITSAYRDHTRMHGPINYNKTYYNGSWPHPLLKAPLVPANSPLITSRNFQRLFHPWVLINKSCQLPHSDCCFFTAAPALLIEVCHSPLSLLPPVTSHPQRSLTPTYHIDCKSKQKLGHCPFLPLCDPLCTPMSQCFSFLHFCL